MDMRIPLLPKNPERVCWGCAEYCPADALACGNGTIRAMHPVELFGEDWLEWEERRTHRAHELVQRSAPTTLDRLPDDRQ